MISDCSANAKCLLIAASEHGCDTVIELVAGTEDICAHVTLSANEAFHKLAQRQFHAILIDVMFDGGKMFELIKKVQQLDEPATPIICYRTVWSPLSYACDRLIENAVKVICPDISFWDLSSCMTQRNLFLSELGSLTTSGQ